MSKELFDVRSDNYDGVEDWCRAAMTAGVVILSVVFCAGIVVGCLIASVLQ